MSHNALMMKMMCMITAHRDLTAGEENIFLLEGLLWNHSMQAASLP